jgi:RluA family pseudouridine synthase
MKNKIRLHHHINKNLSKLTTSNYTNKEIANHISEYGVNVDKQLFNNRLEWVFGNEDIDISHWPERVKASYEGLRMVWEDEDYLVVFKPFGLPVQPGAGHQDNNLVNWLLANVTGQQALKDTPSQHNNMVTAGLVHRLDKDTQGLILIAKNLDALVHAQNQFRTRQVKKSYLTILEGKLDNSITVQGYQYRDTVNLTKQIFVIPKCYDYTITKYKLPINKLKECKTQIIPLITDGKRTFCLANIYTGRMHQIRLAAQSIGHTLANDKLYSNQHAKLSDINLHTLEHIGVQAQVMASEDLDSLQSQIFSGHSYCLLSNYISFIDMSGQDVTVKLFDYSSKN